MITVSKQENGVLFTFTNSDKYLYGSGTIEVPFNSLSIIQDESDNITLRKSASNDIFLSARYDTDFGYASKEEAVNALKEILYDEAGISEEEVQQMIDAATSGIPSSEVVEQLRTDVNTLSGTVSSHTADTTVHFTGTQKSNYDGLEAQYYVDDNWDVMSMNVFNDFTNDYSTAMGQFDQRITANESGVTELKSTKLDASAYTPTDLSEYWTSAQTQSAIDAATSGIPSSQVVEQLRTDLNTVSGDVENKQDKLQYYGEDTEQWEEKADEDSDITAVFTMKQSNIFMDVSGDEGSSQACVQTRIDGRVDNGVLNTGQSESVVNIYANEASNDTEYGSSIEVRDNGVGINTSFTDTNAEFGESLASIDMNNNDVSISLVSTANGDSTAMVINTSGVTINNERVATEPYVDAAISGKADTSAVTQVNNALTAHTANTTVHVSQVEKAAWNAKADASAITSIESSITAVSNDLNTLSGAVIDNEYTVSQAINSLNNRVTAVEEGGSADLSQYWTSAQTQTAIDDAKAYYVDFAAMSVQGITDADWDGLVAAINAHRPILVKVGTNNSYVTATYSIISDNVITITGADGNYASTYTFTKNGSNDYSVSTSTKQFVTQVEKDAWNAKVDTSAITTAITSGSTDSEIPTAKATYDAIQAGGGGITVDSAFSRTSENPVQNKVITDNVTNGNGSVFFTGGRYKWDFYSVGGVSTNNGFYLDTINGDTVVKKHNATRNLNLVETTAITTSMTSSSTDAQVPSAKAIYDTLGGLKFVKLTQAAYDALSTKDSDTLYIISD